MVDLRNVVVICLDSVRKDFFDVYARQLSERSSLEFNQCRATSSWSTPSHGSMVTGQLAHQHGVHADARDFSRINPSAALGGALPEHTTIGVSANVFASSAFGFDMLFDRFIDVSTGRRFTDGLDPNAFWLENDGSRLGRYLSFLRATVGHDHPLRSVANGILAQANVTTRDAPIPKLLDDGASVIARNVRREVQASDDPVAVFTNFGDAHVPLRPIRAFDNSLYDVPADWSTDAEAYWDVMGNPEEFTEYLRRHRALYGAAIAYLDEVICDLTDRLDTICDRETSIVVTADHGESLGYLADHGYIGHKASLDECLLHVPLVVLNPPGGAGQVDGFVSHLDLRTLLKGLGNGTVPDIERERVPAEVVGMSPGPDPPDDEVFWNRMMRCVYEGDTKWVWDSQGRCERYSIDRRRPCWQSQPTSAELPSWVDGFFDSDIDAYKASVNDDAAVKTDSVTNQRLEDLGYL